MMVAQGPVARQFDLCTTPAWGDHVCVDVGAGHVEGDSPWWNNGGLADLLAGYFGPATRAAD